MTTRKRRPSTTETLKETAKKIDHSLLVLWDDLPSWQQDNHYIHTGYRPASNSFQKSWSSLLYMHNETVNIYFHLIGVIFIFLAAISLYNAVRTRYDSATTGDVVTITCFFLSTVLCMGMSATYHTISNHSPRVARFGNKLDYLGIVCLTTGSFVPCIYYGFHCYPKLRDLYWIMTGSLGLGCAAVSIFDRFRTPAWRPYRAAMFVVEGLSGVIPVLHGIELYSFREMQDRMGLNYVLLEGFFYILGATLYAARWPERSSPGAYDIWGSSHQIFHFLVVAAASSHVFALLKAFDYHHGALGYKC